MKLQDLLSEEEINKYHQKWKLFNKKYNLETPYNVHSNLPIIGQVFQFENQPLFRAHIFKKILKRTFDPYFIGKDGYLHSSFHLTHYFFPIEQIAHVVLSKLIPNYGNYMVIDKFDSKRPPLMKGKANFSKNNPLSIELLLNLNLGRNKFIVKGNATFYEDRTNKILQIWYLEGIGTLRNYVKNIQRAKKGGASAIKSLIHAVEVRDIKHKKMISLRSYIQKENLIESLRKGVVPEQELHEFFSYWDKN